MNKFLKKQRGAETLELVVIFPIFFVLVLMVFEVARALYVWNTLVEATRRGARMAVVCPNGASFEQIVQNVAAFDPRDGDGISPLVHNLTRDNFMITYYGLNGLDVESDPVTMPSPTNLKDVAFVNVELVGYTFDSILPMVPDIFPSGFSTTLYAESKGAIPSYPGEPTNAPDCDF